MLYLYFCLVYTLYFIFQNKCQCENNWKVKYCLTGFSWFRLVLLLPKDTGPMIFVSAEKFRWWGSGEVSGNIIHSWVTVFTCQWRTGRIQFEWILLTFLRDKYWKDTNQNAFALVMRWVLICYVFLCLNPFFNGHRNTKVSWLCWEYHSAQVWHLFFLWIKKHWRVL